MSAALTLPPRALSVLGVYFPLWCCVWAEGPVQGDMRHSHAWGRAARVGSGWTGRATRKLPSGCLP